MLPLSQKPKDKKYTVSPPLSTIIARLNGNLWRVLAQCICTFVSQEMTSKVKFRTVGDAVGWKQYFLGSFQMMATGKEEKISVI